MERAGSRESCRCPGHSQGDPLLKQCQAASLGGAGALNGFTCLCECLCPLLQAHTHVFQHNPASSRACISPWLSSFTCTLSTCYSVLPVATLISLFLSPLCCLGCFAASYFTLFIPFDNNNIRTYVQGPKVPALCRYMRKDPSKPVCCVEKILSLTVSRSVRGKGLDGEIRPVQNLTLCPLSVQECQK